jgi:hypothetical protein
MDLRSYDKPTKGFESIKGYLCFYAGPWDCFVNGEKVEPQPGDFYGGWMTSEIERSTVKGGPGTWVSSNEYKRYCETKIVIMIAL